MQRGGAFRAQTTRVRAGWLALAALGAINACSPSPEIRPELLLSIDTTAPVTGQLAGDASLTPALAVDTLRVDVIDGQGSVFVTREFVVPDPSDWPLSFGIAKREGVSSVRVRLRAFAAARAVSEAGAESTASKPRTETVIDRLVDVALPESGLTRVRVVLDPSCVGTPVSFSAPASTCIDADRLKADPGAGLDEARGQPSLAGSSPLGHRVPCSGSERPGRRCVPGGYFVLGEPEAPASDLPVLRSAPEHPVVVPPFWMDEEEYTLGRLRALVESGQFDGELSAVDGLGDGCTALDPEDRSNDAYALTCIDWDTAREICELEGGSLPSEARFEHAARGGEQREFAWGNDYPSCCTASLARTGSDAEGSACPGEGPEPVGSHRPIASCRGGGDLSAAGIADLGGGVRELMLDKVGSFAADDVVRTRARCWPVIGLLTDPVCGISSAPDHVARGGAWSLDFDSARVTHRTFAAIAPDVGFRCVYEDTP